ncbi:hypothetical protein D3C72_1901120 [compost metagenome]
MRHGSAWVDTCVLQGYDLGFRARPLLCNGLHQPAFTRLQLRQIVLGRKAHLALAQGIGALTGRAPFALQRRRKLDNRRCNHGSLAGAYSRRRRSNGFCGLCRAIVLVCGHP